MRRGFTLIELCLVLAVVALLAGIATPSILQAMARARIDAAAAAILKAHGVAMGLARLHQPPARSHTDWANLALAVASYGVAIETGAGGSYVAVTYGTGTSAAEEMQADRNGDGNADGPLCRLPLPGVEVWTARAPDGLVDQAPLAGRIGWFYRYGDGLPLASSRQLETANRPVGIGTPRQDAKLALEIVTGNALGRLSNAELIQVQTAAVPESPVASHLSLRETGGALRLAVSIYGTGFGRSAEF